MKAAWDQVGDVLASNKKIREAQLAKEVSWVWYDSHLKPIKEKYTAKWLTVSAPLQARVLNQGLTVAHQIKQSKVSAGSVFKSNAENDQATWQVGHTS